MGNAKRMDWDTWGIQLLTAIKEKLETKGAHDVRALNADEAIRALLPISTAGKLIESLTLPPYICACGMPTEVEQCLMCWDTARRRAEAAKMLTEMSEEQIKELAKPAK